MIIIFSLTALFILTCSIISAKDHNAYQGEDVASGIGQALKEPIHEFIISEKEKPSQLSSSSNKSMIATVPVSYTHLVPQTKMVSRAAKCPLVFECSMPVFSCFNAKSILRHLKGESLYCD